MGKNAFSRSKFRKEGREMIYVSFIFFAISLILKLVFNYFDVVVFLIIIGATLLFGGVLKILTNLKRSELFE